MNEKFYSLPKEKQDAIINAGFKVFSKNSYKHSPVSEIAEAAGISKSLLFFYFRNKLDLYIFLWNKSGEITKQYLEEYGVYKENDLFDSMYLGMKAKIELMKRYPLMSNFSIKAFYESDSDVKDYIMKSYERQLKEKRTSGEIKIDKSKFIDGLDLDLMYKEMYYASEGYLWEAIQKGEINVDLLQNDFEKLINFWKSVYLKK